MGFAMRKVLSVTTALAVVLLSRSELGRPAEQSSTTDAMDYEPAGEVVRAPLGPPGGYSSPSPITSSLAPVTPYGNPGNETTESQTSGRDGWSISPSWAAIKGDGCVEVVEGEGVSTPLKLS